MVVPASVGHFAAAALVVAKARIDIHSPLHMVVFGALFFWCSIEVTALVVRPGKG
jgi:hypothetical protein